MPWQQHPAHPRPRLREGPGPTHAARFWLRAAYQRIPYCHCHACLQHPAREWRAHPTFYGLEGLAARSLAAHWQVQPGRTRDDQALETDTKYTY